MGLAPVVRAHVVAVESGDPAAMAADYTADAVIERPGMTIAGKPAIEEYFRGVPERLGGGIVVFDSVTEDGPDAATFRWRIQGGPGDGSSGADTVRITGGLISHQVVRLDAADF